MPGPGAFDALIQPGDSRGTVTLICREPPGAGQAIHPLDVVVRDQVEEVAQAPPSLREMAARGPEGREPVGQPQRGGRVCHAVEVQRGPEVVMLELEQIQAGLVRPQRRTGQVLHQGRERPCVRRPNPLLHRQLGQPLGRELPDGFQHREPRTAPRHRSRLPEQAVIDQLARGVQHGHAKAGRVGADALDDAEGDAAAEDRASGQQLPGRIAQQFVTPRYGRAQRPLAGRQVPAAAHQQDQRVVQARQDFRRRQQLHPRGRQLDGQRQPVQAIYDSRDRPGVLVVDGEAGHRGGGAFGEKPHRLARGDRRCGPSRPALRQRQRRDGEFLFPGHVQR